MIQDLLSKVEALLYKSQKHFAGTSIENGRLSIAKLDEHQPALYELAWHKNDVAGRSAICERCLRLIGPTVAAVGVNFCGRIDSSFSSVAVPWRVTLGSTGVM